MSKDSEVEMKDVELNELDQEKQPMTGEAAAENGDTISPTGTEKNGIVKVKIPEDEESKFTGLTKEELLQVAGTPGWVRTRWALLVLFWLGWLGMLAGAVAIIVQAPRCKPLPETNWWNLGPLYQVGDVAAFSENLGGLRAKLESLNQLKVKGLIVGPIHDAKADDPTSLDFVKIKAAAGTMEDFTNLIQTAHKNNIKVVLDLTPNYDGRQPWFANTSITDVAEKLKPALVFWDSKGVDGVLLSGIDRVVKGIPSQWGDIKTIAQNDTEGKRRALFGVTGETSVIDVSKLLNSSGVDLLLSGTLRAQKTGTDRAQVLQHLYSSHSQLALSWNLGDRSQGHLASVLGSEHLRMNQMLLFTLPGTPVFNYGDEIGLEDQENKFPKMVWDSPTAEETNSSAKADKDQREENRQFFKTLSDLRVKERSLLYGDFQLLHNSTDSLAYLRYWDQSPRFLAAFNWGADSVNLNLTHPLLPSSAKVKVSTDPNMKADSEVKLTELNLGSSQAVLLEFPYVA
ncbi:hypothetical protein AGOR_G00020330 [Albula goreensis]|uniref:Glycosyl hydrolase family 13 catalytic domain-containing protein n=1 Tax=Albula goreensis TaxID=1534307 RepID=A0A8T3E0G7_9TELE|nr:hypothetical protein AGOR_G00020330 [Albula goreensis]